MKEMNKLFLMGAALLMTGGTAYAQNTTPPTITPGLSGSSDEPTALDRFKEFRQGVLQDYQEFRHTVLEHYADFLEGTWHEYEPLMPLVRNEEPKPVKIPDVKLDKPITTPVSLPTPVLAELPASPAVPAVTPEEPEPVPEEKPSETPKEEPSGMPPSPFEVPKTEIPPEAKREIPPTLKVTPDLGQPLLGQVPFVPIPLPEDETPVEPEVPAEENHEGKEPVRFYGMEMWVPKVDFNISESLEKVSDFARHWKLLDEQNVAERLQEALTPKMQELGLNDYLAYEFLCAYMDSKFPGVASSPKYSAVHYMLANMGFNARIAVATKSGEPIILIPAEQKLYGVTYMTLNGTNFYVLGNRDAKIAGQPLATCDLPKGASSGKKFDMHIQGLNLPRKDRKFNVKFGDMQLSGVLNENLMPVVYRYPQMNTGGYAKSCLDQELRDDLVRQVKEQLGSKDQLTATNDLLKFVQSGFEYATDDEFHGFEKPYFLEENFYYPKNDCEDRAILYTYLLWNALSTDNQLIAFPGHESASVSIPGATISGVSYEHNGKRYYISDPTFIGANTGMCMRRYETTAPTIDHIYPDK